MKIALTPDKKADLAKALATLLKKDPSGKFLDALAGAKLPKSPEEMTEHDIARVAAAEAKRARKIEKRK